MNRNPFNLKQVPPQPPKPPFDPNKLLGCLIVILVVIVTLFCLMLMASQAHADVQEDACMATNTEPCPKELPIKQDDDKLNNYGGSRVMGANTGSVIYLRSSLNLDRCFGKQYRFHEDVHTVQRGRKYQDETEAYRLQKEFYRTCMEGLR